MENTTKSRKVEICTAPYSIRELMAQYPHLFRGRTEVAYRHAPFMDQHKIYPSDIITQEEEKPILPAVSIVNHLVTVYEEKGRLPEEVPYEVSSSVHEGKKMRVGVFTAKIFINMEL